MSLGLEVRARVFGTRPSGLGGRGMSRFKKLEKQRRTIKTKLWDTWPTRRGACEGDL